LSFHSVTTACVGNTSSCYLVTTATKKRRSSSYKRTTAAPFSTWCHHSTRRDDTRTTLDVAPCVAAEQRLAVALILEGREGPFEIFCGLLAVACAKLVMLRPGVTPMPNAYYLVESSYFTVSHGGRDSQGVAAATKGSQTTYLHVLPLTPVEVQRLRAKKDDAGNADHTRFAIPGRDDWWIAVDGEAAWPGIPRPRITSRFQDGDAGPMPAPLSEAELDVLRKAGLAGI
jgi:hypothetical protein